MFNEIKEAYKEIKQIWAQAGQEIKAIWVYEWHQVKAERLARQAERTITELKKNPYL
jgi:nuclear transport factor 2 (NTF2) superfamily protein